MRNSRYGAQTQPVLALKNKHTSWVGPRHKKKHFSTKPNLQVWDKLICQGRTKQDKNNGKGTITDERTRMINKLTWTHGWWKHMTKNCFLKHQVQKTNERCWKQWHSRSAAPESFPQPDPRAWAHECTCRHARISSTKTLPHRLSAAKLSQDSVLWTENGTDTHSNWHS